MLELKGELTMKRLSGIILALVLLVGLVLPYMPVSSSAAEIENYKTTKDFSGLKLSVDRKSVV